MIIVILINSLQTALHALIIETGVYAGERGQVMQKEQLQELFFGFFDATLERWRRWNTGGDCETSEELFPSLLASLVDRIASHAPPQSTLRVLLTRYAGEPLQSLQKPLGKLLEKLDFEASVLSSAVHVAGSDVLGGMTAYYAHHRRGVKVSAKDLPSRGSPLREAVPLVSFKSTGDSSSPAGIQVRLGMVSNPVAAFRDQEEGPGGP